MTTITAAHQPTGGFVDSFLDILCSPASGAALRHEADALVSIDGSHRYRLSATGIPLFAEQFLSAEATSQREHYNKIAAAYMANLGYPHTREYLAYLDRATCAAMGDRKLGTMVELCCGGGEGLILFGAQAQRYIGVDVSETMLETTQRLHGHDNAIFVQGDATRTPLAPESVDTVVMLGGVHHVPARAQLFSEIERILKPGGRFLFREPVSDFAIWRGLRAIIYRLSPMLDDTTERPLLHEETVPVLEQAGLQSLRYETHGFLGFCLFMNSDVLFFNRLFRFVPGIRAITRMSARLDEALLALPGLHRAGLQVVGLSEKPTRARGCTEPSLPPLSSIKSRLQV
jgi:ubiquinone/menaquinone biosynthesis C-methylase UbiE